MSSEISRPPLTELHDLVEARGLLVHRDDIDHIDFNFVYRDVPFEARAKAGNEGSEVEVKTTLGYLPYTAEGDGRRQGALKALDSMRRKFGSRVGVRPDMRLVLKEHRDLPGPLTPGNLLTEMVLMLVDVRPFLDELAACLTPIERVSADALAAHDHVA